MNIQPGHEKCIEYVEDRTYCQPEPEWIPIRCTHAHRTPVLTDEGVQDLHVADICQCCNEQVKVASWTL